MTQSETEFLKSYTPDAFDRPNASVDTAIFTVIGDALHVLVVKREHHPHQGKWSLVGGFIDLEADESLEDTAKRKLQEKTGVKTPYLEQWGTIGNKQRDPRYWSITTVYFALIPEKGVQLRAGEGATDIKWVKVGKDGRVKEELAFDHAHILKECHTRLRQKVLYTSLPLFLMEESFTLGELQKTYETLIGDVVEAKSFRRRILSADLVKETGEMHDSGRRPAKLYELVKRKEPHFFLRNIEGINL